VLSRLGFCREVAANSPLIDAENVADRDVIVPFGDELFNRLAALVDHELDVAAEPLAHPLVKGHVEGRRHVELLGERDLTPRSGDNLPERLRALLCIVTVHGDASCIAA
jgi:hypothetical protein